MIERDRFKPTLWLYKTLMKILAQAGYTHMVFALFKRVSTNPFNYSNWRFIEWISTVDRKSRWRLAKTKQPKAARSHCDNSFSSMCQLVMAWVCREEDRFDSFLFEKSQHHTQREKLQCHDISVWKSRRYLWSVQCCGRDVAERNQAQSEHFFQSSLCLYKPKRHRIQIRFAGLFHLKYFFFVACVNRVNLIQGLANVFEIQSQTRFDHVQFDFESIKWLLVGLEFVQTTSTFVKSK